MKILVIEARYYEAISEDLLQGALAKLQAAGAEVAVSYTHLTLPTIYSV